ncbi:MAG TPA: ATP-binding protein [candidate division Zixibacteria bacterium]|nr:ATP-binding protein [candidate division Zixibacteria bacterium]
MSDYVNESVKVVIPNRMESVKWLYPVCEGLLKELPLSDKKRHMILVALSEGFTNAFQHGNQKDPDTEIKLTFYPGEKSVKILIEDNGILPMNKNINHVSDKADPEGICGRGLLLMRELVDEAYYERNSKGANILTLINNFENKEKRIQSF